MSSSRSRAFRQVDVFTDVAYAGNPVAVVLDGEGLNVDEMQRFAHWTNLSETTFVLAPRAEDADYRVRIFTTVSELPFAGHPTLGTCHAWLETGGQPKQPGVVVQECEVGLVSVRNDDERLAFAAPPLLRSGVVEEPLVEHIASVLGIGRREIVAAEWADNGPGWVAVLLESAETARAGSRCCSRARKPCSRSRREKSISISA
jgi:PhzF family phenazine biosynthesis protein